MKLLLACAGRHGATHEIASHIAERLAQAGHDVDLTVAEPGRWLDDEHDGYVVGSAVYYGRWLRGARHFVEQNAVVLRGRPVWLFSSGPVGRDDGNAVRTHEIEHLLELSGALSHRVFGGRLDPADLKPVERIVTRAVHAVPGDYRNWDEIDSWCDDIHTTLVGQDLAPTADPAGRERKGG